MLKNVLEKHVYTCFNNLIAGVKALCMSSFMFLHFYIFDMAQVGTIFLDIKKITLYIAIFNIFHRFDQTGS